MKKITRIFVIVLFICILAACQQKELSAPATTPATKSTSTPENTSSSNTSQSMPDSHEDNLSSVSDLYKVNATPVGQQKVIPPRKIKLPKYDMLGVPFVNASLLKNSERLGWGMSWKPENYSFQDYSDKILPQAWERPLTIQDISARYNEDDFKSFTLQAFNKKLLAVKAPSTDIFESNQAFIGRMIEKQQSHIRELQPNNTYAVDFNKDGKPESLSISRTESRKLEFHDEMQQLYTFKLSVNGRIFKTLEYTDADIILIDLETIQVIIIDSSSYNADTSSLEVYCFKNKKMELIGNLGGRPDLIIGEGRFTTVGRPDTVPHNGGPVDDVLREYIVKNGKLCHVRHEWLFSRAFWEILEDLPLYDDRSGLVTGLTIHAGTNVVVTAYSPGGWLYLVSESGEKGYIQMSLTAEGIWDYVPYALPGGKTMDDYFVDYGGVAG